MNTPLQKAELGNVSDNGMARFLSPTNLRRYRSLAADRLNAAERGQILHALGDEWNAFKRECRATQRLPKVSSALQSFEARAYLVRHQNFGLAGDIDGPKSAR
jgi:hypothetical protein